MSPATQPKATFTEYYKELIEKYDPAMLHHKFFESVSATTTAALLAAI